MQEDFGTVFSQLLWDASPPQDEDQEESILSVLAALGKDSKKRNFEDLECADDMGGALGALGALDDDMDEAQLLLFGDMTVPDESKDRLEAIPPMKMKSENTQFLFNVDIPENGIDYLNKLKKRFDRVAKRKGWVASKRKSTKKKNEPAEAVSIVGGQLFINVEGKPSVRIFPRDKTKPGKMTVQGPTHEGNLGRADEIVAIVRKKWTCSCSYSSVLTSTYCGVFVGYDGVAIRGLKLKEFNEILRRDLTQYGLTSFFNPEKDNCVTIWMKDGAERGAEHGDENKQGQLRVFASGKVTGFGVKSFDTLHRCLKIATEILWNNFSTVTTEVVMKKQKTEGSKRNSPMCSQCGNTGHNKRTCTKK